MVAYGHARPKEMPLAMMAPVVGVGWPKCSQHASVLEGGARGSVGNCVTVSRNVGVARAR